MQLFQKEQYMPGKVIDRDSMRGWRETGSMDTFTRAQIRVQEILASYKQPELDPAKVEQLQAFVLDLAHQAGMEQLPLHDLSPVVTD
jgi:trimethylamine:corrinoid methyltransferase-like protein